MTQPTDLIKEFDENVPMLLTVKEERWLHAFILSAFTAGRESGIEERNIGMLRQWLNEDRKCEPMVTNDDIKYWLNLSPTPIKLDKE